LQKQSEEDRKMEPATRKHLHEQVNALLKRASGVPPLLVGPAEGYIVPKIMEWRRQADSPSRKLLDGLVAMNMGMKNLSDPADVSQTLMQLSEVYAKTGNAEVASRLHNASIFLPALMVTAPKLRALNDATSLTIKSKVEPLIAALMGEIEPFVRASESKIKEVISQTLWDIEPRVKMATLQASAAVNETVKHALEQWRSNDEFASLRSAIKALGVDS